MCPHEQQYNTNSNQDEEALQDKFESLLVLNLDELNWLKGKPGYERKIKSLLTLNSRNILVTLRLMKAQRTRLANHAKENFKSATTRGGGRPKAWK